MPAKNSQLIDKKKFSAVINSLKLNNNIQHAAELHHIQPSSVQSIRSAKTWDEYERRKTVKATKAAQAKSAQRAMHPAPRPTQKKAVAPSHAKQGVTKVAPVPTEQPVSPHMLNEAYEEVHKALNDVRMELAETKALAETNVVRIKSLETAVSSLQRADVQRIVTKPARNIRWPFGKGWNQL